MCSIVFISHSLLWRYIKIALRKYVINVPIARVYPSILLVNHIRGTGFKLLYINISKDSPYFRCPDEERFYPFKILAFRTLKL